MTFEVSARTSYRSIQGLLGLLVAAGVFSAPRAACAADPEPVEIRQVAQTTLPTPNFAPSQAIGLRWDRETSWTVLALTDPWELREDARLSAGPLASLGRMDLRENAWQATPYAATTVASAFAALATQGIPIFAEVREFRTIRTHRLGCYFKGRGGGLVWRLEF
jgi:hypothetical protein